MDKKRTFVLLAIVAVAVGLFLALRKREDGPIHRPPGPGPTQPASTKEFPAEDATATIRGRAVYKGTAPPRSRIAISGDEVCVEHHGENLPVAEDKAIVVNEDGSLWNAIVYVESEVLAKYEYEVPPSVLLDQQRCLYRPHAMGAMQDQKIEIKNSDQTMHNVRYVGELGSKDNLTQQPGQSDERIFEQPELVRFQCDRHSWMGAHVLVLPHPFHAATGETGTFELPKLLPGDYTVVGWHELLGKTSARVTVEKDGTAEVVLEFAAK